VPHVVDYASSKLRFYLNGKFITLQGENELKPDIGQLHHFRRLQHTNAISEMFTLQQIDPIVKADSWLGYTDNKT